MRLDDLLYYRPLTGKPPVTTLEYIPDSNLTVYLAGPISGKGYHEVVQYFLSTKNQLMKVGYKVLHPMIGKAHLRNELKFRPEGYGNPTSTNRAIRGRDFWMVGQSDIIYVNFMESGDRVSIGSVSEIAVASERRKHIVVAMQPDNIHRHAFILDMADVVFETHEDAMGYLTVLGRGDL